MSIRATVVFVRHGETQENRDKIIQGQMDSHLNKLGRRQADAVAEALRDMPFTHALSSDLSRAKETAEAILKFHDIPLITQRELREKSSGAAEGLPFGTRVADQGESSHQFRKRVIGWWIQAMSGLLADSLPDGLPLTILVVSHGGVLRCLLKALTSDPNFHFTSSNNGNLGTLPNTGTSKLELVGVYEGRLLSYADNSHLGVLGKNGEWIESLNSNVDDLAV